jgi:hypothetical protein
VRVFSIRLSHSVLHGGNLNPAGHPVTAIFMKCPGVAAGNATPAPD